MFYALPLLHDTFLYSGPTGWWVTLDLIMSSCIIFLWGILLWCYHMIFHVVVQTSRRYKLVDRDPESWREPDWNKCPCFLSPIGHHRYRRNAVGVSLCKNANFKELSTGVSRQDSPGLNKELHATKYWKPLHWKATALTTYNVFVLYSDILIFQDEVCKVYNEECCYAKCTKAYRLLREIFSIAFVNEAVSGFR